MTLPSMPRVNDPGSPTNSDMALSWNALVAPCRSRISASAARASGVMSPVAPGQISSGTSTI